MSDFSNAVTAAEVQEEMNKDDVLREECLLVSRKQTNQEARILWKDCGSIALSAHATEGGNGGLLKRVTIRH